MTIQAVIFDFDGVILETEGPYLQAWAEVYREFGLTLPLDNWVQVIGAGNIGFDPLKDIERQVGAPLNREQINLRRRQRKMELIAAQQVLPGVTEFLQEAQRLGIRVGLASSSPCDWVVGHLERLKLRQYFYVIRAADDVDQTKPDPELYLAALRGLGVSASQAFAVEDSPNGIMAAKRAGLFCVAVPHELTRELPLDHADMILDSLSAITLESLIREIERRMNGKGTTQ